MKANLPIALAVMAIALFAFNSSNATDNNYQRLDVFGDFGSGIYIDGSVAEAKDFLEYELSWGLLDENERGLALLFAYALEGRGESESVLVQPLGGKPSYNDTFEADAYVNQGSPDTPYGGSGEIQVGCYTSGSKYEMRALWRGFECPASGEVIGATLYVYIKKNDLINVRVFYVGMATSDWSEYSVTWNKQPDSASESSDVCTGYDTGWYPFSANNPVMAICNSGATNYGLKMFGDPSWASSSNCVSTDVNIHLDTKEGSGNTAYLAISYAATDDDDDTDDDTDDDVDDDIDDDADDDTDDDTTDDDTDDDIDDDMDDDTDDDDLNDDVGGRSDEDEENGCGWF